MLQILIGMTATGPEVTVTRDGQAIAVRHAVGVAGGELELALNRFDLFEPDEPVRDRTVRAFATGFEAVLATAASDETRLVLVSF